MMKFLLAFLIFTACSLQEPAPKIQVPTGQLEPIAEYETEVPEPSGLSMSDNGDFLWTVSDQTGMVYAISFRGRVLKQLAYQGQDLEGVVQNPGNGTLWVVEEQLRQLVKLDTAGNELARFTIDVEQKGANSGLEGVAYDPSAQRFFLLNEKDPSLFITLDGNFNVRSALQVDFVNDCSGLTFELPGRCLWLLSDASRMAVKMDTTGAVLAKYTLPWDKAEGVAVDNERGLLYIVNDSRSKLYHFKLPK